MMMMIMVIEMKNQNLEMATVMVMEINQHRSHNKDTSDSQAPVTNTVQ